MEKIFAIKGMNDILPSESNNWLYLEEIIRKWVNDYGYSNIRTPILENTKLFNRSIGEVTDIVEKEMYSFIDVLNQDELTLRPEGTASVVRAIIEHNLLYNTNLKLWYMGPMFRHERPQKGRYRQFHQIGIEAFGFKDPAIDAEIVLMQCDLFKRLNIKNMELQINCLGDAEERNNYKRKLIEYFEKNIDILDINAKQRMYTNPLRILDSKNLELKELIENAPKLIDYLNKDSINHYELWKSYLKALKINFKENTTLVRGLDYYNLSVFEFINYDLSQNGLTVSAGGRFDKLLSNLGGKENYAIGFAIGVERLLLLLSIIESLPKEYNKNNDIYLISLDSKFNKETIILANELRNNSLKVTQSFENISLKAQLKKANLNNYKIVIIIGENEILNNSVMVKLMFNNEQHNIKQNELVTFLQKHLIG